MTVKFKCRQRLTKQYNHFAIYDVFVNGTKVSEIKVNEHGVKVFFNLTDIPKEVIT